jgi:acetoin:2,6-dichlorophenolindophenol oxidoreductase subunit alpha
VQGRKDLVACFFGDGAVNRGPFLEGLNWAKIHDLAVLFVCEDNRWSATTATGAMTAGDGALARARAIGVDGVEVDGNDVFAVDSSAAILAGKIRQGEGPKFLHAITYRFKGHVSVDAAAYRDGEEVARALENDPLDVFSQNSPGIGREELARIQAQAGEEVALALQAAAAAPWPDKSGAYTDIQDTGSGRWLG